MPNSSDSSSVSGSAAQLMATNGPSFRGELPWMRRATISLPVPDSPRMSTLACESATRATRSITRCIFGESPTIRRSE